jgi:predicted amidohydrolase
MKIGYVQFAPVFGDIGANIEQIGVLLKGCREADLLVLPELASSGYRFASRDEALSLSQADDGEFVQFLATQCARHDFHLVAGFSEREDDLLYNSSVLVGPRGVIGKFRKLHLFMDEKDIFEPGDLGLPVFDIGICKVGMLVCFDWVFPEVWRVLALEDADIICHPSNLVLPYAQQAVPVHAMCNRIYAVTCNRTGTEKDLTFTGQSIIASPKGEVLSRAATDREATGIIDIDIEAARNKSITPRNDVITDRRPGVYARLTTEDKEGS